jgi:hypothetical protein
VCLNADQIGANSQFLRCVYAEIVGSETDRIPRIRVFCCQEVGRNRPLWQRAAVCPQTTMPVPKEIAPSLSPSVCLLTKLARQTDFWTSYWRTGKSSLSEGTKTDRLRICWSSGEVTLAADSICRPCVCSDTYVRLQRIQQALVQQVRRQMIGVSMNYPS